MNVELYSAPWCQPELTGEAYEALDIIGDDVWSSASVSFYAECEAKKLMGKSQPKGMQRFLNVTLDDKFDKAGWIADSGYFVKEDTWLRVTFRHQMSLGSDLVDAIKVCKKEHMKLAMIFAADSKTLKTITPNDCNALVSFEKLEAQVIDLDGAIDIPLIIGKLTPRTTASLEIDRELRRERPRDITVPARG